MQIDLTGSRRDGRRRRGATLRRLACGALLVAVAALHPLPGSASSPPPPVIDIPGDHPLPGPGERVVVPVPAGGRVRLDPEAAAPSQAIPALDGTNLVLRLADGGTLVLQDFFASVDPPASLVVGETVVPADTLLAQLAALRQEDSGTLETAAGPAAGGGGEMFGMLQVVAWLVDRLDPVAAAEAGEGRQLAEGEAPGDFAQLAAQLRIARDQEIAGHAADYRTVTREVLVAMRMRVEGGGGSAADVALAEGFDIDARIQEMDAAYQLLLSIDAHQDAFGERLESAAFPTWRTAPPDELPAIAAALPAASQATARRFWRQARHARETVALLETLVLIADELSAAYEQQFEVAQRSLAEVEGAYRTAYQARIRLAERRAEQLIAEAWLLAAMGELPPDHIKHPGWQ